MDLGATEGSEQRRDFGTQVPMGGISVGGHQSRGIVLGPMGMVETRPGGVGEGVRKGRLGVDSKDRAT